MTAATAPTSPGAAGRRSSTRAGQSPYAPRPGTRRCSPPARQETAAFAAAYAVRAGIAGTLARGVRTCALRRTRSIGQARTHLGHVFTATALNFLRLGEWLTEQPRARSRRAPFVRLMAASLAA